MKHLTDNQRAAYARLKAAGHYSRAGRIGGARNLAKHGREHLRQVGALGGNALLTKYGVRTLSRAGRIGQGTWNDDAEAVFQAWQALGKETA